MSPKALTVPPRTGAGADGVTPAAKHTITEASTATSQPKAA